jgi:hypothetical protein
MEKIYNKLRRFTIPELKAELDNMGVSYAQCKIKEDYIRAFLKKKTKTAKLTPKKKTGRSSTVMSEISSGSKRTKQYQCIIESMDQKDVVKLENYLKRKIIKVSEERQATRSPNRSAIKKRPTPRKRTTKEISKKKRNMRSVSRSSRNSRSAKSTPYKIDTVEEISQVVPEFQFNKSKSLRVIGRPNSTRAFAD